MTKAEQIEANKIALKVKEKCYYELTKKFIDSKGFNNKLNAWVYETENYFILKHYDTFVAAVQKGTHLGYDFLRSQWFKKCGEYGDYTTNYSNTSARHIANFFKKYDVEFIVRYREV